MLLSSPLLLVVTAAFIFIFGALLGSFFNVIIYRHQHHQLDWYRGRSQCENCQHPIKWHDNLPLLSFVRLRGKCRYCQKKISLIHPAIELATALLFLFGFLIMNQRLNLGPQPNLGLAVIIFWLVVIAVGWLIILFDSQYFIIPDSLVLVLLALALTKLSYQVIAAHLAWLIWVPTVLTALAWFLLFFGLWCLTRGKGFGLGDVKLVVPLSLLLGYPRAVVGVFSAFILGALFGILLIVAGRKKFGQVIPFGPFLIIGSWLGLGWGRLIWDWYWQLVVGG